MTKNFAQLFQDVTGVISANAYDTAWVALVPRSDNINKPQWPQALQTLRDMQLADGGWGAKGIYHAPERTLCTLAAICVFLTWQEQPEDCKRVARGIAALHKYAGDVHKHKNELVGYELILPRLLQLLEPFDLDLPDHAWSDVLITSQQKMSLIGKLEVTPNRPRAWWFSAEMLTAAQLGQFDESYLNHHGALVTATAPTAAFLRARRLQGQDSDKAAAFLDRVLALGGGGAAMAWPVEHYEQLWMIDQLKRAGYPPDNPTLQKLLKNILLYWSHPPFGLSSSAAFAVADGDDTTVGYDLLRWAGFVPALEPLLSFWNHTHFQTYSDERTTSITVNLHALSAVKHDVNFLPELDDYAVKTVNWLKDKIDTSGYATDKWHYSPIYVAAHTIDTLWYWDRAVAEHARDYLLAKQHRSGGWGGHQVATVEETGFAVIGLVAAYRLGLLHDKRPLRHAAHFLHSQQPNSGGESLWIGKTLFHSPKILQAILFAANYGLEQLNITVAPYQNRYVAV